MSNTTEHYDRVKDFMTLAKQDRPESPTMPDVQTRELRASLILEEALETVDALGFNVYTPKNNLTIDMDSIKFQPNNKENLVGIVDGVIDVSVVTRGALIACGIPDKPFLEEVDNNNLAKFGPGHSYREDGKLIKPPDHKKPDIEKILAEL